MCDSTSEDSDIVQVTPESTPMRNPVTVQITGSKNSPILLSQSDDDEVFFVSAQSKFRNTRVIDSDSESDSLSSDEEALNESERNSSSQFVNGNSAFPSNTRSSQINNSSVSNPNRDASSFAISSDDSLSSSNELTISSINSSKSSVIAESNEEIVNETSSFVSNSINELESTKYANVSHSKSKEKNVNTSNFSQNSSISSISSMASLDTLRMSREDIEKKIRNNKMLLKSSNVSALPDKGARLKEKITMLEAALSKFSIDDEDKSIISLDSSANSVTHDGQFKATAFGNENSHTGTVSHEEARGTSLDDMQRKLKEKQIAYKSSNIRNLPDGGTALRKEISTLEKDIMMATYKANINSQFDVSKDTGGPFKPTIIKETSEAVTYTRTQLIEADPKLDLAAISQAVGTSKKHLSQNALQSLYGADKDYGARDYGGKLSDARARSMYALTSDAVSALHATLKSMPDVETEEEPQPRGLKVDLLPHQKRALKWLLWRESQMPPGGILADDMGLGKTLTMFSLILRHNELVESGVIDKDFSSTSGSDSDSSEKWLTRGGGKRELTPSKGSLVVCPASLLGQWEGELRKRVSSKKLSLFVYHGTSRSISLSRLAQYDVVVTTYHLVVGEAFSGEMPKNLKKVDTVPEIDAHKQGPLFRIGWTRIILDEGHVIRNHKTKCSQAACMLRGGRRWVTTGTPVQNKENDFYALVRFLRVQPFDDYTCWKHQLKGSSANALRKLSLLVKTILLRRMKDQVDQVTGEAIVNLPDKEIVQHKFALTQEEREVYDRVFAFSRKSLIEYMKSQEEKEAEKAMRTGESFKPKFAFTEKEKTSADEDKYTPTLPGELFRQDIKAHHMLVLLLRLRQICCHPALIVSIIEEDTKKSDGIEFGEVGGEDDLISQMAAMDLTETPKEDNESISILNRGNPVFKKKRESSKIRRILEELDALDESETYEKAVIVSQWTSMLEIVYKHLKRRGISVTAITGNVPVKERASILEEFNREGRGPRVLLLSLLAGGVGLNLVAANHLFLLDMHWNPQLETQACDRIYRVGQKKNVKIHRFVVENTVEEKILALQQSKLELADAVLTGAKRTASNKLTFEDIKVLFSLS